MAQAKKRQKFFDVDMPLIGRETQLYGFSIEELKGRIIKYDMTRISRGKSMILKLKVDVKDGKAVADPIELRILPYFIKRMMRKGTNYVEDSFSVPCKDAQVRIKPFLITRKKVSRVVRKTLREKAREELTEEVKSKDAKTLFEEITKNKIQKTLSLKLKKIYPLSLCEIRVFKIEKNLEEEPKKEK
jgi:ribosomal protein S3AE